MADKASFLMYLDTAKHWDLLSDAQAGALIKALFRYCESGEKLKTDDGMLAMAFSFIAAQIDRDSEKYERTCKKRSESGKNGGRPKKQEDIEEDEKSKRFSAEDAESKKSNCFSEENKKAKKADNDNDNENDTETDNESDIKSAGKPRTHSHRKQKFIPPTVEEVRAYCAERKNGIDPQRFVNYYNSVGWKQNGQRITDWKSKVQTWESQPHHPPEQRKGSSSAISSIDMDTVGKLMNPYGIGSGS